MQIVTEIAIMETLAQLRSFQKRYPSECKPLQMLVILRQQGSLSKYAVAEQIGSGQSSVGKRRSVYAAQNIDGLLVENRGGNKAAKITLAAERKLRERLHNPKEDFRSFIDLQQWLTTEFGIELNYQAVNKFVKRKYGAKLKVSRKSHVLKSPADEAVFKNPAREI